MMPNGLDEIIKVYGDYKPFLRGDYTVSPSWERAILATCWLPIPLKIGWVAAETYKIRMNKECIDSARTIFCDIAKANLWPKLKTFDGCYAWRQSRTSQKLSTHCWGIAVDLNAATNQLGETGDMDPKIVEIFEGNGWVWGGRWERPDPMHFQACRGY